MTLRITRRQLALTLITAFGGLGATIWLVSRDDEHGVGLDLPPSADVDLPSFEVFLALSKIVLMRDNLDIQIARQLYSIFMDEPWGPKHIGHAYAILREWLLNRHASLESRVPIEPSILESGERWFVSHLLTTWYLGVYYHEKRPAVRITRSGALMHEAVRELIPIRFVEATGFGEWSKPPTG